MPQWKENNTIINTKPEWQIIFDITEGNFVLLVASNKPSIYLIFSKGWRYKIQPYALNPLLFLTSKDFLLLTRVSNADLSDAIMKH